MFTGIVTDVGRVRHLEKRGDTHVVISTNYDLSHVEMGASIACSGICMTVVDKGTGKDSWFAFTASGETLSKTTWEAGRSAIRSTSNGRCGSATSSAAHIVSGHVDGVADRQGRRAGRRVDALHLRGPVALSKFIASKGSVALDGVSLTVNEVDGARFGVNIIPHTQKVTTFGKLKPGSRSI
ncbi:MAG: riboflavin synthase [Rhizomicrobium sp.]